MSMRGTKWILGMVIATGMAFSAEKAMAAASITLLGDSATLRVTTYSPSLQVVSPNIGAVYGTSPLPTITTTSLPGGNFSWKITFNPSSQFFAAANNAGGGKTTELDGKLDFIFTADAAFNATVNVFEDGIFNTTGAGTKNVTGGVVVTNVSSNQIVGNSFGPANFAPGGLWTLSDQVGNNFSSTSTSYKISIDNALFAEALGAPNGSSAYIAKKDFSIIITTNGSGGGPGTPEPASIGVLALGSMALIARRRKA